MQRLNKLLNFFFYFSKLGSAKLAWFLAKHNFPGERIGDVRAKEGKLQIVKTGQTFSTAQLQRCQESLALFLTLAHHKHIQLDNSKEGEITMVCDGVRIKGDTFDNFYVVQELFADGVYNINMNDPKRVICDVGMNVGVASLYFAAQPSTTKVYSYEPFPSTYQRALNNFEQNPAYKHKIVPHNAGVGGSAAELEVPMIIGESAVMSTSDFFIEKMKTDQTQKIKVAIEDIKKILPQIMQNHPGESVILKLDCEGAEYDIIDQLNQTGLIKKISMIVIEWHMKGYESLNNTLVANNFCTTVFPRPNAVMEDTGMIYAVNRQLS